MIFRLLLVVLVLANLVTAVAIIETRHAWRRSSIALTNLQRERDDLNVEYGRLQLELATLAQSQRIDQIARTRLGMQAPGVRNTVVVQP